MSFPTRRLGSQGLNVSSLGLGCMGMSNSYGLASESDSLQTLHRYVELGGNFIDTAEMYGPYTNEELIGKFLKQSVRNNVLIATKFGFKIDRGQNIGLDSSPANIRKTCDESLTRLGIETIDLLYQHRVDPSIPIEDVVGAMAELVQAGKVRFLGLSEASSDTLRKANAIHPISALQTEYSLWTRDVEENGVLATCRELGIGFVAYSPLGRGFLTGTVQSIADIDSLDRRQTHYPRFQGAALDRNLSLANHVIRLAEHANCTPAQLALAWVLAQEDNIVPIPGTKRIKYLEENLDAAHVVLSHTELEEINQLFPLGVATGERYATTALTQVDH